MNDQSIPAQVTTVPQAVISQRSPITPQSESVPSVVTVTSDTDVTMGVEELDNGGSEVNASQSQPVDDLIVFDTLDTAEDEIVVISGHNSDIVESHCGEIFTIV
ncbi:hypothetical protein AbraIFM66950_005235 [Aspergillus brasiliensis]|nr:hypothetical protein AbraIFM66950_005235 [Aspergillus brasiliensis]